MKEIIKKSNKQECNIILTDFGILKIEAYIYRLKYDTFDKKLIIIDKADILDELVDCYIGFTKNLTYEIFDYETGIHLRTILSNINNDESLFYKLFSSNVKCFGNVFCKNTHILETGMNHLEIFYNKFEKINN